MAKGKYQYWIEPDGLLLIQGWAREGLTDEQIAKNMGVSYSTMRVWRDKFPAMAAALKKSKEIVDYEVENALLKRARGYRYEEITKETRYDQNGEPYTYERRIEKEMPPDVTAQIFWLKNRQPAKWRDKPPEAEADRMITVKIDAGDYGD